MYPYIETLKVGAAYMALLYIWPCILFRRYLRGKGLGFRFMFCGVAQPLLISTVVLSLGMLRFLNLWLVRALFWGALAVSLLGPLLKAYRAGELQVRLPLRALVTGAYGWKMLFSRIAGALSRRWGKWEKYLVKYRKMLAEYLVLAAILLFGSAFFLSGAFADYSFGCTDQYNHYEWTYALLKGRLFSGGVYPQGMHSFLYALHVLFGVKLYSCVLFLGGIHNSLTFLLAAYCLLKELFSSRHTPLLVLAAWLVFEGAGQGALEAMSRMGWTLPQEFGLYLVFLCPLILLRYLRGPYKLERWYQNGDLLLLLAGTAYAASTHFYVLIMALLSCCAAALAHYREAFTLKRLRPAVCAALYGLEIGMLPMLIAFVTGTDLESSALRGFEAFFGAGAGSSRQADPLKALFEDSSRGAFAQVGVLVLIALSLLAVGLAAACIYARRKGEGALPAGAVKGYLTLGAALAAFGLLYGAPFMGLPGPVPSGRVTGVLWMLALGAAGVLADQMILWAGRLRGRALPGGLVAVGCLILYLSAYMTDFHQNTCRYLRRYNAAVTVTDQIMNNYPKGTYRIVSMGEEAYQAGEENHEELLTFLENCGRKNYSIPVEYVFLYVEKRPILQSQVHFPAAPPWLARPNQKAYGGLEGQSLCPDVIHSEISLDLIEDDTPYYPKMQTNYSILAARTRLCSEIYGWYQDFSAAYPAETHVYYEDDDLVCFMIHQDGSEPLKLATRGRGKR